MNLGNFGYLFKSIQNFSLTQLSLRWTLLGPPLSVIIKRCPLIESHRKELEKQGLGVSHRGVSDKKELTILSTVRPGGGGVLPYIAYTGMCRPTRSWFWSFWFRMGYPFQRHFLERGIIFWMHESSSFVSSHLKLFKDRLLLKIRFNALTSKLLYSFYF